MPTVNNLTASQVASSKPEAIQSTDSTPAARATGQALRRRATSLKVQVENTKLTDSQRASGKAVSKLPSDNQQASCATDSQPLRQLGGKHPGGRQSYARQLSDKSQGQVAS